jgi:hypothetical protein
MPERSPAFAVFVADESRFDGSEVESQCHVDLHLLYGPGAEHLFLCLLGILYFSI